jgi:hypothetical protein
MHAEIGDCLDCFRGVISILLARAEGFVERDQDGRLA